MGRGWEGYEFSQCGNYLSRFFSKANGFVDGAATANTSFNFNLILNGEVDWLSVMVVYLN